MTDKVTLHMPHDVDETYPISYDIEKYRPYLENPADPHSHWCVDMPREIAGTFLHNAGFYMTEPKVPRRDGDEVTVAMHHVSGKPVLFSAGDAGLCMPDKKGVVQVPVAYAEEAKSHGFVPGDGTEPVMTDVVDLQSELARVKEELEMRDKRNLAVMAEAQKQMEARDAKISKLEEAARDAKISKLEEALKAAQEAKEKAAPGPAKKSP